MSIAPAWLLLGIPPIIFQFPPFPASMAGGGALVAVAVRAVLADRTLGPKLKNVPKLQIFSNWKIQYFFDHFLTFWASVQIVLNGKNLKFLNILWDFWANVDRGKWTFYKRIHFTSQHTTQWHRNFSPISSAKRIKDLKRTLCIIINERRI